MELYSIFFDRMLIGIMLFASENLILKYTVNLTVYNRLSLRRITTSGRDLPKNIEIIVSNR